MGRERDPTPVWKALSDATRRRILDLIRERPRTTGELSASFDVSRYAVMKHLAVLASANLVVVRRRGRVRWNHLNVAPLAKIDGWLAPYQKHGSTRQRSHVQTGETLIPPPARPASGIDSILIEHKVILRASRSRVFRALTGNVSSWWGAPYLQSERARSISLEPRLGGHLVESWGNRGGAIWGTVTTFERDSCLVLSGNMAMPESAIGIVRIDLHGSRGSTVLHLQHRALGVFTAEVQDEYDRLWRDLLKRRLKSLVEKGEPLGIGHEPETA